MLSKIWAAPLIVAAVVLGVLAAALMQGSMTIWAALFYLAFAGGSLVVALRVRKKEPKESARAFVPWLVGAAALIALVLGGRELNIALLDMGFEADGGMQAQAEAYVAAQLRDPSSAQFRAIEVVEQPDGRSVVCGEVNGKNAYGGYVGFTRFVWDGARLEIEPSEVIFTDADNLSANTSFLRLHTEVCVRAKTEQLEVVRSRATR